MPPVINPRGVGSSWGTRLAIMAGRVLPPGGIERTMLGGRCEDAPRCGDDACREAGKCLTRSMLMCGACWDAEKVSTPLIVLGPLDASVGISCGRCGATGSEAQPDTGVPTGYAEAMARIAEWNAMIEQRIERREQCDTPFAWLPLWHPGSW